MTFSRLLAALTFGLVVLCGGVASAQSVDDGVLTYEIRAGDTLFDLAERYFLRTSDYRVVQRINRVRDPRRLPVGQSLRIPATLLRSSRAQARVLSFRGDAGIERDGRAVAVVVGQVVEEGDVLLTGQDARIQVELPDGGRVTLPSQSRGHIGRLRQYAINGAVEHELVLSAGRAEVRVSTVRQPGSFRIRTPLSVSAVRGTEFRVAFSPEAETGATTVIEGVVEIASSDGEDHVRAQAGEGAAFRDNELTAVDLLAAPRLEDPDEVQVGRSIEISANPLPGADRYRVELAADAGFIESLGERNVRQGEAATFEVARDGVYFARLSAISDEGVERLYADYAILRARNGLRSLEARREGLAYRFRWEAEGAGTASYRFQLGPADAGQPPMIDQTDLTATEFHVSNLPSGAYEWRVQATRQVAGRFVSTWSAPHRLQVGE